MAKSKELELLNSLSPDSLKPVYLLHGDEPFYVELIGNKIQEIAIPEHEKGFNEIVLYGKDITIGNLLNNARRFPMMAAKQLVLVKEAQDIQDLNQADQLFEQYVKAPLDSTILVLMASKGLDERKAWIKAAKKSGVVLKTKKPYDNEVAGFINQYVRLNGLTISNKASMLLFEHVGNNLKNIANEIDKILPNIGENKEINDLLVEQYVGISKDFNVFELQKALGERNAVKSFRIGQYFASNAKSHPIQPVLIILFGYFTKLIMVHASKDKSDSGLASLLRVSPYFLKDYKVGARNFPISKLANAIEIIRIIDQKSKGIDIGSESPEDLYKELIYKILS